MPVRQLFKYLVVLALLGYGTYMAASSLMVPMKAQLAGQLAGEL